VKEEKRLVIIFFCDNILVSKTIEKIKDCGWKYDETNRNFPNSFQIGKNN
jgi:hypothetical protein